MNVEKEKTSTYFAGNKFFIVQDFDEKLRDGIIIPLTNKIDELGKQKDAVLDIYVNSHGGWTELCLHIVSLMELAKSRGIKVRTIVPDTAYSAGSVVAMAGTPGERYIAKTAEHCAHYGTHYGYAEHTPLQTERNADHKKRHFKKLLGLYQTYANIPDLEEHMKDDSFFIPAPKAIKWGLADKYLEELK